MKKQRIFHLKYYFRGLGLGILVATLVLIISSGGKNESLSDAQIKARAKELGMTESTVLATYAQDNKASGEEGEGPGEAPVSGGKGKESTEAPVSGEEGKESTEAPVSGEEGKESGEAPVSGEEGEESNEAAAPGGEGKEPREAPVSGEESKESNEAAVPGEESKKSNEAAVPGEESKKSNEAAAPGEESKEPDEGAVSGEEGQESEETPTDKKDSANRAEPTEKPKTNKALSATAEPVVLIINRGDGSYTVSEHLKNAELISSAADFDRFLVENGYDKRIVAGEHMIPTDADEELIAQIITGRQ